MRVESVFDLALSCSYNPTRVSFVPDDVDTADITYAIEIKSFERTPIATVTAFDPIYLHGFL